LAATTAPLRKSLTDCDDLPKPATPQELLQELICIPPLDFFECPECNAKNFKPVPLRPRPTAGKN
jgi:hypothetical protein